MLLFRGWYERCIDSLVHPACGAASSYCILPASSIPAKRYVHTHACALHARSQVLLEAHFTVAKCYLLACFAGYLLRYGTE